MKTYGIKDEAKQVPDYKGRKDRFTAYGPLGHIGSFATKKEALKALKAIKKA
jgi:hypothetical protein